MRLMQELHVIRAYHLHYMSLLDGFLRDVQFIEDSRNPFLSSKHFTEAIVTGSREILERECRTLKGELQRLKSDLHMQEGRVTNVVNLVRSTVYNEVYPTLTSRPSEG